MLEHGSTRVKKEGRADIDRSKPVLFARHESIDDRMEKEKGGETRFEKEGKKKGKGFAEDTEEDIGGGLLLVIGYEIGQNDDDRSLITVFYSFDS